MSFRTFFQRNEREHASRFVCQRDFGLEEQMFLQRNAAAFSMCQKVSVYARIVAFTKSACLFIFCSEEVALYMQIEKNIAATLQRKMKAAGKTKLEFSKELGIPRSTFQEYLKGDKCLRSDSIEELAKSLSISPAQLISGPEYTEACGLFGTDALACGTTDTASSRTGTRKGGCFAYADSVSALGGVGQTGRAF